MMQAPIKMVAQRAERMVTRDTDWHRIAWLPNVALFDRGID
jgi:hypothetical protein